MNFTTEEILVANKTSRASGAVGAKAIVPRTILAEVEKNKSVLDFGAGKSAIHAKTLRENGYKDVTAWEFGDNFNPEHHEASALKRRYDVVYASNVLNVQSSLVMLNCTLAQIYFVTAVNGKFYFNYPNKPRKFDISTEGLLRVVEGWFGSIPKRVGGTASAPVISVTKII